MTSSSTAPGWQGGPVGGVATCVLAPNPGPMTLDGTNTWVLLPPGSTRALVVDPGPADRTHLAMVVAAAAERGAAIEQILLTHGHADHSGGAPGLAELTGAPVRALDPRHRLGVEGLGEGDVVAQDGIELRVVPTPGHTADSLSFLLAGSDPPALLTGDTVLGRGTTMIAYPEGDLGDYLDSLGRLRELAAGTPGVARVLPGHGPVLTDPVAAIEGYLAHRQERLGQITAALAAGARTAPEVVATVYAGVERALWPAAEQSVRAQLAYLGVDPAQ